MGKELTMGETGQIVFEFDDGDDAESASDAVIEAVATAAGDDPLEIEPLYSVVDPDALDALLNRTDRDREGNVSVTFPFHGYEVTVWRYGRIHLSEPDSYQPNQ